MAALTAKRCPRLMSPCRLGTVPSKTLSHLQQNTDSLDTANPAQRLSKHIHSDSDKSSSDVLVGIRKHLKGISKLRDNLTNAVSYLGAISVEVPNPGRFIPDYQKYIPSISFEKKNEKESEIKSNSSGEQTHGYGKHLPPYLNNKAAPTEDGDPDAFEKAMNETHESVHSYCVSKDKVSKAGSMHHSKPSDTLIPKNEVSVREEATILSMFARAYKSLDPSQEKPTEKIPLVRKDFVSRTALTHRTKSLVQALKNCTTNSSRVVRTEELSKHLLDFPESRGVATKVSMLNCKVNS